MPKRDDAVHHNYPGDLKLDLARRERDHRRAAFSFRSGRIGIHPRAGGWNCGNDGGDRLNESSAGTIRNVNGSTARDPALQQ